MADDFKAGMAGFRELLQEHAVDIMLKNSDFYPELQALLYNDYKKAEIKKAIGLPFFVHTITTTPLLFQIPLAKQFETCLKTVLVNYGEGNYRDSLCDKRGDSRGGEFAAFIESIKYEHYLPITEK